jgi:magnesium-transporting ATPase (P-type)
VAWQKVNPADKWAKPRRRLDKFGPNAMPDTSIHPLRMALEKFWAPVPWMLEAAIVLELVLGKYVEAAIIAALWYSTPRSGCSRRAAPRRPLLR